VNRKQFLTFTAGGLASLLASPSFSAVRNDFFQKRGRTYSFEPYRSGKTAAPVYKITPNDGAYLHTFFDVCPWSPSGRLLAITRVPYENRKPVLGDVAEICIIDLDNQTIRTVYRTQAWSFQLGTHVQWGNDDTYIYSNDVINHVAVCVRINIDTGETTAYAGPKYDVARSGKEIIGSRLELLNATQYGYGIPDTADGFPVYAHASQENRDGLWHTDLTTNKKELLFSYGDIRKAITDRDKYQNGVFYFFHSKFNPQATRIMQVVRCLIPGNKGRNSSLFTLDLSTNNLREIITRDVWEFKGPIGMGNHPNWHPNGDDIVMNLVPSWEGDNIMRFCKIKHDGSQRTVLSHTLQGSGHPSIDGSNRYIVTDAYPHQSWAGSENGEVPIRLIDLTADRELQLCTIFTDIAMKAGRSNYKTEDGGSHLKLDPHPVWSRDFKKICFNGVPNGQRQVFVCNLESLLNY